jgi:hypothetical protein
VAFFGKSRNSKNCNLYVISHHSLRNGWITSDIPRGVLRSSRIVSYLSYIPSLCSWYRFRIDMLRFRRYTWLLNTPRVKFSRSLAHGNTVWLIRTAPLVVTSLCTADQLVVEIPWLLILENGFPEMTNN